MFGRRVDWRDLAATVLTALASPVLYVYRLGERHGDRDTAYWREVERERRRRR
jgi:hypothetical protein